MRTTVRLDDDVAAGVERLRRQEDLGLSEAVNLLARRGLTAAPEGTAYQHQTRPLGIKVDVTDIGAVLELLDEDG